MLLFFKVNPEKLDNLTKTKIKFMIRKFKKTYGISNQKIKILALISSDFFTKNLKFIFIQS